MFALMPDGDDSVRCSVFARSIDLDPRGTAIGANAVVTIDTPLPWPKPVFDHPLLASASSKMITEHGPARVLATVPQSQPGGANVRVCSYWRGDSGTMRAVHSVAGEDLAQLLAEIAQTGQSAPSFETERSAAPGAVLICTQGSHDLCCGSEGMRFVASVVESQAIELEVVRVSHTGGHRFAPTGMTLPDGRMWAFLDDRDLTHIHARSATTASLANKCRGWWGAEPGPAQVAEIAVWAEIGWDWDDAVDRTVTVGDSGLVQISGMGRRWEAEVVPSRQVPTIACNKPGGAPAKTGQEWRLTRLTEY